MTTTTSTWLEPIPGLWRDEAAHRYWLGDHDGAYVSPALSERRGREVRVLYDLKTLSDQGRPYSTAAQLGGYMVLEAAQGNHYELGQTIWSMPGEAFTSTFYSREQCLAAWAAAWSSYCLARRPF